MNTGDTTGRLIVDNPGPHDDTLDELRNHVHRVIGLARITGVTPSTPKERIQAIQGLADRLDRPDGGRDLRLKAIVVEVVQLLTEPLDLDDVLGQGRR